MLNKKINVSKIDDYGGGKRAEIGQYDSFISTHPLRVHPVQ